MTEGMPSRLLGQHPTLASLSDPLTVWDVIVVGGGITGAGILLEAARRGWKALLLEQKDFAWGTSSRSSKMVHGGLRYIAQGDLRLTRHSLQERERLLNELPELVVRMPYLFPVRAGRFPGRWPLTLILKVYDALAGIRDHRWIPRDELLTRYPQLGHADLRGAMHYTDALTDDSRLVIRVLQEAMLEGASARNHTLAESIERDDTSPLHLQVVQVRDQIDGTRTSLQARHVFNATGLWADRLSATPPVIRPQRGTHLFLDAVRLPVSDCLTFMHPRDGRPVFAFPWKGQTCIGTTDLDHQGQLNDEPFATQGEVDYLLEAVNHQMPQMRLLPTDVQATMAGVRPIIASGKGRNPSRERRDHLVWQGQGVISVSGGKLTTFRQIALDALLAADLIDPTEHRRAHHDRRQRCFRHQPGTPAGLDHPLQGTPHGAALRAQLDWILQHEMVVNLDDLLLRRLRVGTLQNELSRDQTDDIRAACQRWLGWTDAVWHAQWTRYSELIATHYRLPADLLRTAQEAPRHG